MDLSDLVYYLVQGLHGEKNSEQAAGLVSGPQAYNLGRPTKALHLAFSCRAHYSGPDRDGQAIRTLHFLFNRPWGSKGFATTHTFATTTSFLDLIGKVNEANGWEHLSSHDSCWRSAVWSKIGEVTKELQDEVVEQTRCEPNEVSISTGFVLLAPFYRWVDVQIDRDETDKHGYRKLVKVL